VRIAEVDRDVGGEAEFAVAGHFLTLIPGRWCFRSGGPLGCAGCIGPAP
jgi:hypothetical protein